MASEVDICNIALTAVGSQRISSLTQNTDTAKACNDVYETIRDALLRSHFWRFAGARAELEQNATDPICEYDYQYHLPNDYLRDRELYQNDSEYIIEGGQLLTNTDNDAESLYLIYTKRVINTGLFDPYFAMALAYKIAAHLALSLKENRKLKETMILAADFWIKEAYRLSAIEGKPPKKDVTSEHSWVSAGR